MSIHPARATGAEHPPSPTGTPSRRARTRLFRAGLVVLVAIAAAATVVAAEPAANPDRSLAAQAAGSAARSLPREVRAAQAARPVVPADEVTTVGYVARLVGVDVTQDVSSGLPIMAPTTTTTTTTVPPTTAPPTTAAPAPVAPSGGNYGTWDRLAQCESGGNWGINTGNGYYGGLQFSASSWRAVGGTGLPHQNSRETQIAMGERLRASQGWGAWPACSRKLGLR